jgi:hypothetical protein
MLALPLTILATLLATTSPTHAQVIATNPNGATNPSTPSLAPQGTPINQTSMARLLSLNGVDDFCLFGPPENGPESLIGNVEPIVVAYCTKVSRERSEQASVASIHRERSEHYHLSSRSEDYCLANEVSIHRERSEHSSLRERSEHSPRTQ